MKNRGIMKQGIAFLLVIAMMFSSVNFPGSVVTVRAEGESGGDDASTEKKTVTINLKSEDSAPNNVYKQEYIYGAEINKPGSNNFDFSLSGDNTTVNFEDTDLVIKWQKKDDSQTTDVVDDSAWKEWNETGDGGKPTDAGDYLILVKIIDNNETFTGSEKFDLKIVPMNVIAEITGEVTKIYDGTVNMPTDEEIKKGTATNTLGIEFKKKSNNDGKSDNNTEESIQSENTSDDVINLSVGDDKDYTVSYEFDNKNADEQKGVIATISMNNSNYSLATNIITKNLGTITQRTISPVFKFLKSNDNGSTEITEITKEYDGTTNLPENVTVSIKANNVIDADKDKILINASNMHYNDKKVGKDKSIIGNLNILDADGVSEEASVKDNYSIQTNEVVFSSNGEINEKIIKKFWVKGDFSKDYDGTGTIDNNQDLTIKSDEIVEGDTVQINASYSYEDSNAGEGKKIIASDINLTGEDSKNYIISDSTEISYEGNYKINGLNISIIEKGNGEYAGEHVYNPEGIKPPTIDDFVFISGNEEIKDISALVVTWQKLGKNDAGEDVWQNIDDNPKDVGTYKATVSVSGNYIGSVSIKDIVINQAEPNISDKDLEELDNLTAYCGQTLSQIPLPDGFTFANSADTKLKGGTTVKGTVNYDPKNKNYKSVSYDATITVSFEHNSNGLQTVEKLATEDAAGQIKHYHCGICSKNYKLLNGKYVELSDDDMVVPYIYSKVELPIGKSLKLKDLVPNGQGKVEKVVIAKKDIKSSKNYITVKSNNEKNIQIKTKKNYDKKFKSIKAVVYYNVDGLVNKKTVNIVPVVAEPTKKTFKVKRENRLYNGVPSAIYSFNYKMPGVTKVSVKISGVDAESKNIMKDIFEKRFIGSIGKTRFYVYNSSIISKNKKITFVVTAHYGKNKSKSYTVKL